VTKPVASRGELPPGYGTDEPGEVLPWADVEERLAAARNYWLCTVRPDGRPHAKPVWAFWIDGALVFSTHPGGVSGRNMGANPSVAVHLESGDRVVALEGEVSRVRDADLLARVGRLEREKYDWPVGEDELDPDSETSAFYRLLPRQVLAWDVEAGLGRTITRFDFAGD
jgi:hypothetical protein